MASMIPFCGTGISRLAKVGGEWTEDEGAADKERPSQFERGNAFQLRIVVGKDNYGISVGGADGAGASYRVKFAHKIPLDDVVRTSQACSFISIAFGRRELPSRTLTNIISDTWLYM